MLPFRLVVSTLTYTGSTSARLASLPPGMTTWVLSRS